LDCENYKDDLLLYAAGALDAQEAEPVRRHLAGGCPACAGALAEAQATLALLAMTLPLESPPPALGDELMRRVATDVKPAGRISPATAPVPAAAGIPWWMQLAIPSAIAASIAAALTIFFAVRIQNRAAAPGPNADLERTLGVLTAALEEQQHELATLRSPSAAQTAEWAAEPNLKILSLAGTGEQPAGARGRVFWDSDHGVWHFFADGMKPAPAGKTYELWFVSSDQKIAEPAGSFDPASDGSASLVCNVPPDIAGQVTIGAVTDEPAGANIAKPSGSFQLKGQLN
jgi:hypothetical protein